MPERFGIARGELLGFRAGELARELREKGGRDDHAAVDHAYDALLAGHSR
jgi:hypothetical protein